MRGVSCLKVLDLFLVSDLTFNVLLTCQWGQLKKTPDCRFSIEKFYSRVSKIDDKLRDFGVPFV
jgi:hypothetical protein